MNIVLVISAIWVVGSIITIAFIQGANKNTIENLDELYNDKVNKS
jgi:hypothetical protein